ncbi:MAG: chemotaxis protein CheA [Myxococcota bacterium]
MTDNRDMIEQLRTVFFEEAEDGLNLMESGLLRLDEGERDPELINGIFRAAHSIKGGSGTFGFSDMVEFTHCVETLLDRMRGGTHKIDGPTISVLLRAVDGLRSLLMATVSEDNSNPVLVADTQAELEALLQDKGRSPRAESFSPSVLVPAVAPLKEKKAIAIQFSPHTGLMRTGNDPILMLRELRSMGDMQVDVDTSTLPEFDEIDPEDFYLRFDIRLTTSRSKSEVGDVFVWVEDDADIEIKVESDAKPALIDIGASAAMAAPSAAASLSAEPSAEAPSDVAVPLDGATGQAILPRTVPFEAGPPNATLPNAILPNATLPKATLQKAGVSGVERMPTETLGGRGLDAGSIRVGIEKIDALINLVGELVITQSMLGQIEKTFDMSKLDRLRDGLSELERNTRQLQESVLRIRMLPIRFVLSRFPRMVRDCSQKLDKKVKLTVTGEGTDLDKTVMEKIGDPLMHLVRNALDHGLESPEVRREAGKSPEGHLQIHAYHQGGSIVIEVRDDGAGLDEQKIIRRATERGLIDPNDKPSNDRALDLIFSPGFSTKDEVSELSGRGVGLDVVRRNIRDLGGHIEVASELGIGTVFTIRLPLTLAILDGQLVQVGRQTFIVPLASIVETLEMDVRQVRVVAGRAEVYRLRDEYVPLVRLHELFGIPSAQTRDTECLVTVVEGGGQRAGILIDDLRDQQQVVIKSLESNFRQVDGVSGATILGDGTVALILDTAGLINFATQRAVHVKRRLPTQERRAWS